MTTVQTTTLAQQMNSLIQIQQELDSLNEKQKELRQHKNNLQDSIIQYMKENDMDHRSVKMGNHQMYIASRKQYSGITFHYLDKMLGNIIPDENQKSYVLKYLRENREIKDVPELRLKHIH